MKHAIGVPMWGWLRLPNNRHLTSNASLTPVLTASGFSTKLLHEALRGSHTDVAKALGLGNFGSQSAAESAMEAWLDRDCKPKKK